MTLAQRVILGFAPRLSTPAAAGVEAAVCLRHGTLDHLSRYLNLQRLSSGGEQAGREARSSNRPRK